MRLPWLAHQYERICADCGCTWRLARATVLRPAAHGENIPWFHSALGGCLPLPSQEVAPEGGSTRQHTIARSSPSRKAPMQPILSANARSAGPSTSRSSRSGHEPPSLAQDRAAGDGRSPRSRPGSRGRRRTGSAGQRRHPARLGQLSAKRQTAQQRPPDGQVRWLQLAGSGHRRQASGHQPPHQRIRHQSGGDAGLVSASADHAELRGLRLPHRPRRRIDCGFTGEVDTAPG